MPVQRTLAIFACSLILLAAACGSSKSSLPSACSLLSVEQLSQITGLTFGDGEPIDVDGENACFWSASDRQGEVSVLETAYTEQGFVERVADAASSFGEATSIKINDAKSAVEFGEFGVVVMNVNDHLIQVQQSLPITVSPPVHLDLAAAVARSAS